MFRVKEYNPVYDPYFGEDKGWIYITNEVSFWFAIAFIFELKFNRKSILYYGIDPIIPLQLTV